MPLLKRKREMTTHKKCFQYRRLLALLLPNLKPRIIPLSTKIKDVKKMVIYLVHIAAHPSILDNRPNETVMSLQAKLTTQVCQQKNKRQFSRTKLQTETNTKNLTQFPIPLEI